MPDTNEEQSPSEFIKTHIEHIKVADEGKTTLRIGGEAPPRMINKDEGEAPAPKKAKARKSKSAGTATHGDAAAPTEPRLVLLDTSTELDKLLLPLSEADARWDARMTLKLDPDFVKRLADEGIRSPLDVTETAGGFVINAGRTRARAIPEANKLRAKAGLAPLIVPLLVTETDEIQAMHVAVSENEGRRDSPPTIKARTMMRMLDAGIEEQDVCKSFRMSGPTLHSYLALLDLPEKVQKLVDAGDITRTAAMNLIHLDAAKVEAAAEKVAAAAALGVKTSSDGVKQAAGIQTGSTRLPPKTMEAFIKDIKLEIDAPATGARHKLVLEGARLALELALDARKRDAFFGKVKKAAE